MESEKEVAWMRLGCSLFPAAVAAACCGGGGCQSDFLESGPFVLPVRDGIFPVVASDNQMGE